MLSGPIISLQPLCLLWLAWDVNSSNAKNLLPSYVIGIEPMACVLQQALHIIESSKSFHCCMKSARPAPGLNKWTTEAGILPGPQPDQEVNAGITRKQFSPTYRDGTNH